jgi:hypothetical protein
LCPAAAASLNVASSSRTAARARARTQENPHFSQSINQSAARTQPSAGIFRIQGDSPVASSLWNAVAARHATSRGRRGALARQPTGRRPCCGGGGGARLLFGPRADGGGEGDSAGRRESAIPAAIGGGKGNGGWIESRETVRRIWRGFKREESRIGSGGAGA